MPWWSNFCFGQRESEDVREKDRGKEMAANSAVEDITKDGQEETPEIMEQIPASESNLEEMTQPAESQGNDVGFKKVFKFVGFKFTVKKDKNEKSDAVQLLTVKKEEGEGTEESAGAGDHQEPSMETGEPASKESELKQSIEKPEDTLKQEQNNREIPLQVESAPGAEGEGKDEGEEKPDKEPAKSPQSPTSPVTIETTSSFKKFFTHGWAGWRKKTSFRKPKEDELEASEKKKEQEPEKVDDEENEKTGGASDQVPASEPQPQEPAEGADQARLSADYEKVELPLEDQGSGLQGSSVEKCAPLATEVFDEKIEVQQEVIADVHVSTLEKTEGQGAAGAVEEVAEHLPTENNEPPQEDEASEELVKTTEVCVSGGDYTQLTDLSPDEKVLPKHPEGIVSEAEMLSSQERIKVQGSPLKKLFSSSGLKKLSGKKQRGKRGGGGGGDEEPGELQHLPTESPESADEQKGDSSASSPEEPEEITCLEKGIADGHQEGDAEEGATSDGEKKREGITPWASFKKMVTPKKRVRRPSESDKEEEPDKVKSATLSSTESAASEIQEEGKAVGDEQKPEEPKRKVDTSVSWEALICVGSSKKRARKASSSDDESGPRTMGGDTHRVEEANKDKETSTDAIPVGPQEHDQGQGSSSPEPAGSPSEGEGVSTWESFKRLVTPRKKSKSKLEDKIEDSSVEHLTSDVEPGKEESWVSIKKFIPGRRKKRSDGKQDQATVGDAGTAETNEEDSDVPAVVPLSEYDAVEREKMEAQQVQKSAETTLLQGAVYVSEELSKTLVHTVSVTVIDGTRAVTSVEERSPSWISASVTEPLEQAEDEATPSTEEVTEREAIAVETPTVTQTLPESKDVQDYTVVSEVELTSEAVTAGEATEALGAEEVMEASGAEETTDMVSAVSQLTDSPDTTEEATPVQEVEGATPDMEEQKQHTQAILQAVAEKVKEDSELPDASQQENTAQSVQRGGPRALEKVEEAEEDSEALVVEKEKDVVLEQPMQETDTEHFREGSVAVETAAESFEESLGGIECGEPVSTCETGKPQQLMEQATAPDSADTLTDSETNGSTPVADPETISTTQPDEVLESQEDNAVAKGKQSQVAQAALPQEEGPTAPPSFQSEEGNKEQPKTEGALELTQQELSVEAVPALSKTEVIQEVGQFVDEKVEDEWCVEGLEVSAHGDGCNSQEKIDEVSFDGDVTEGAEGQKSESLSPEERKVGSDVEKAPTKPEQVHEEQEPEVHQQPNQMVDVPGSGGRTEVSSLEGSSSLTDQKEAGCTEVQVQSSYTLVAPKEDGESAKVSETGDSLESAGIHLIPAEKSSEEDEKISLSGEDAVPLEPKTQAESTPVIGSAASESALHFDLEGEGHAAQKQRSDEGEQAGGLEDVLSAVREGDPEAKTEISELETESSKLVQSIIQTAVDQFAHTEEKAPEESVCDLQTQASSIQAESQELEQTLDKEESHHQASAQDEALTTPAQEASQLGSVEPALSDISKDVSKASDKMNVYEVESASMNDQQFKEVTVPPEAEGDGNGTKPVSGDGCAKLGECIEKPPSESKDQKGDAAADPEYQKPVLAEADALGILTKESPDTNGPKLTEEGVPEGKMPSELNKELKPQTEEDPQKPERELAES